jgi:carboxyl-terminal processing protease
MIRTGFAAPATAFLLALAASGHAIAEAPKSRDASFDRAVDLVERDFYDPAALPRFEQSVREALARLEPPGGARAAPQAYSAAIGDVLTSLGASHTGHYTRDELAYYELADIFRFNFRQDLRRLFPPDGHITYPGIGIATETRDGKVFVSDVYDGAPADRAGIMRGDEIVSVDGAPFAEIDSFRGREGKPVTVAVRREQDAGPRDILVTPADLPAAGTLVDAIARSAHIIEEGGHKIGYLHIWTFAGGDVEQTIDDALSGPLAAADALVVDLRGRWGGAPPDAAEIFLGGTPPFRFIDRDGKGETSNVRWHKPLVGVIALVGANTAGNLLGGRGYMLPDGSLLELAVAGVEVDGHKLEGVGVAPDEAVPFDIRYSAGRDPQLAAAVKRVVGMLAGE